MYVGLVVFIDAAVGTVPYIGLRLNIFLFIVMK